MNTSEDIPTASQAALWQRSREAAIPRLSQSLAMAISIVLGDLTEQLKMARDMNHYRLLEQAKDTLRHGRDGIVTSFQRRYDQFSRLDTAANAGQGSEGGDFSLMSDSEFQDANSHDVVAQTINTVCDKELRGLERRFRDYAKSLGQAGLCNPLNPDLIGRAVLVALREREVSVTLRHLLAPMLAEHLASQVQSLYQDTLQRFTAEEAAAPGQSGLLTAPRGGIGGTGATRTDAGAMLAPAQPRAASLRGRAMSAALLTLTRLQQGQIQLPTATAPATTEVLQRLAEAKFMADIGSTGRIALDMVAAMFEAILCDRRIASAVKAQLGRLQVPMLKVALLDPDFLKRPTHPARQFLDALVEASRNPAGLTDSKSLEALAGSMADRIACSFEEDLAVFATVLPDLQQWLAAPQCHPNQSQASCAASTAPARPDKAAFRRQINALAEGAGLPKAVLAFLAEQTTPLQDAVYTHPAGVEREWLDPGEVLDGLVRTLTPLNWQANRAAMLTLLPAMLRRLKLGMQNAGIESTAQDAFLAGLAKCHALVMQAARQLAPPASAGPVLAEPAQAASLRHETAAIALPPVQKQTVAMTRADRYDALVRSLQRGALIEFRDQGGSMTWLKLAWISPNGGIFVFTNRQGERALTLNAAGLAERFRQNQAQIALAPTVGEGAPAAAAGMRNVA
jgi:hypothetical protein